MPWDWLRGHHRQVEMFRHALQADRLASTFLFIGPDGVGKRSFAVELAKSLLCETNAETDFESCGHCPACVQVAARSHPDLLQVRKPDDRSFLPIELFIGDRDHRMQQGLCHDISLKPYSGRRKIAVIDDADLFNQESANCLLKTLEEPPLDSMLILLGTSEQKQLPTIRSRSQVIRFQPLSEQDVRELLARQNPELPEPALAMAASQSEGSLTIAGWMCDESTREFREELLKSLSNVNVDTVELSKRIAEYIEGGGSDGNAKRARMRQVARIAAMFYRELLLSLTGASDEPHDPHVTVARQWLDAEQSAVDCIDRCVTAESQVDANVNAANWTECLVNGLTRVALLG